MAKTNGNGKLSMEEFTKTAITKLRGKKSKGIHTRFSGFNEAFREYFGKDVDVVAETKKLADAGVIDIRPCKGGVMIYLAGECPTGQTPADVLAKIVA